MFVSILRSPDGDQSSAGDANPANTSGGAANTAAVNPDGTPATGAANPTPDPTKAFNNGATDYRSRTLAKFAEHGIEPVLGANGKPSITLTIEAIAKAKTAATPTKKGEKPEGENEELTILRTELEAMKATHDKVLKEAESAKAEAAKQIETNELTLAFAGLPIIQGRTSDAIALFRMDYTVKRNAEGEVRVYKGRELQVTADHASTVKEVAAKFLDERDYLKSVKAATANVAGEQGVVGGVRYISKDEFAKGPGHGFTNEDIVKRRVIVRE